MSQAESLQSLVKEAARKIQEKRVRIAVVGDLILDNSIEGVSGGIHPDMKVPVLRDANSQESIGGAANIALALARLGVDVSMFGIIGSDLPGRQLENLLDRQSFAHYLITERGWPTPRKDWIYRKEEEGKVTLTQRIDYDRPLAGSAREELVSEFRVRCPSDVQVLILADHGLGCIGPESLALIGLAKQCGAKIVAIPRTTILRGQTLDAIILNPYEMRNLADAGEAADPKKLAVKYAREYAQHVFLSQQEEGFMIYPAGPKGGEGFLVKGYSLENPDWMGVRDATTAAAAAGFALGLPLPEIGQLSNFFRHLTATQRGNGRVTWRDVNRFVGLE